jgi:hypothetical protein
LRTLTTGILARFDANHPRPARTPSLPWRLVARTDPLDYFRGMMSPGEFPALSDFFQRPPWQALAACRNMVVDVFIIGRGASTEAARAVCARCPVVDACLEYALADDELVGVWGGTSEVERRAMRRATA